uniref:Peptide deformylase n=1 Tax=Albugo laibachii Nc14 TaxID=890382 RepID=F0WNW9_9STRA|nr:unnamed protein product [Albugo laibachii Nc14]|eukprot:CCA23012.1 unnamed protein product [Albugo laibachii Nc14]
MTFAKKPFELIFLGNSALRRICEPVFDVKCPEMKRLAEAMRKQLIEQDGVGIAAPQLGANCRLFLMSMEESNVSALEAVFNPKVTFFSKEMEKDFEGCLSVPHYSGIVKRSREIQVQYSTALGMKEKRTLEGFPARVFQHELDHLNGVLFLDKVEPGSFMHNREYEAMEWNQVEALLDK